MLFLYCKGEIHSFSEESLMPLLCLAREYQTDCVTRKCMEYIKAKLDTATLLPCDTLVKYIYAITEFQDTSKPQLDPSSSTQRNFNIGLTSMINHLFKAKESTSRYSLKALQGTSYFNDLKPDVVNEILTLHCLKVEKIVDLKNASIRNLEKRIESQKKKCKEI